MQLKDFDSNIVAKYGGARSRLSFGDQCEVIGEEILKRYEHFEYITKPQKTFRGQPFDRLCRRKGKWYIVEIKGSQHGFGGVPSHTQKRRMIQVLEQVQELEPVLLQIDRENARYKIRYGQEAHDLIAGKEQKRLQIDNIIGWVENIISSHE
jgi:hypothetical protein